MSSIMSRDDRSPTIGMNKVEVAVVIHKPIAEVWAFAADFEHDPVWRSEVQRMRHTTPLPRRCTNTLDVGVCASFTVLLHGGI